MKKYSMKCSCGHVMAIDANSREEAVTKMKEMMTQEALEAHMKQYHKPEEPMPTLAQAHQQIDMMLQEDMGDGQPMAA